MGNYFSITIESRLQSAWGMGFDGSSLQVGFSLIPSVGCYGEDEELNSQAQAVIAPTSEDANCLWFALLASYHIGDATP